jgi:cytochrome c-type biogenesis protein CcmF
MPLARFSQNLLVMSVALLIWAALMFLLRLLPPERDKQAHRKLGLTLGGFFGLIFALVLCGGALLNRMPADFLSTRQKLDWTAILGGVGWTKLSIWGIALVAAGMGASLFPRGEKKLETSGKRAMMGGLGLIIVAGLQLWASLLGDHFELKYVAEYSRTTQPWYYKLSAFWGGQAGSLLFWALILSIYTAFLLRRYRKETDEARRKVISGALLALSLTLAFFTSLVAFVEQPFALNEQAFSNGFGLNPLLQNLWMTIHPPMLYLGYIGCAVPFAIAFGALAAGEKPGAWLPELKHHALIAWLFLSVGIILGGWWAYITLGWGGYWAWDPVENASLLPWLTLTAFLHGRINETRRGLLPWLNYLFLTTTFGLSLYGTFLTRSGILSSVHAFAAGNPDTPVYLRIGPLFLVFLGLMLAASLALLVYRMRGMKSRGEPEGFVTREMLLVVCGLLLTAITLIVLIGVSGPIFHKQIQGEEIARTRQWYDTLIAPVALALLWGMAIGPLLAWRRSSGKSTLAALSAPLSCGVIFASLLMIAGRFYLQQAHYDEQVGKPVTPLKVIMTFLAFCGAGTVLAATVAEFWRGGMKRRASSGESTTAALWGWLRRSPDAFGGYIAHCGLALMFIGFAASSGYQIESTHEVKKGESFATGPYTLTFEDAGGETPMTADFTKKNEARYTATVAVSRLGGKITRYYPAKVFYATSKEPKTTVEIRYGILEDLYLVFGGYDPDSGEAGFKTYSTPMVGWIWLGILIVAAGGMIALFMKPLSAARTDDDSAPAPAPEPAPASEPAPGHPHHKRKRHK